jgi:iron complex outermembrane receptor protein
MKLIIFMLGVLATVVSAADSLLVTGSVIDKISGQPVAAANIRLLPGNSGTSCDESGQFGFRQPDEINGIQISAVGYRTKFIPAGQLHPGPMNNFLLEPEILSYHDQIVVIAPRPEADPFDPARYRWLNSTDDALRHSQGVSMMRRANFALEPSIRGMSAGQIAVVIDGMKIHSACIDRMDPVSAYIEVENLDKLEISRGSFDLSQAATIGGSFNFITRQPDRSQPFYIEIEPGYESSASQKRLRSEINLSSGIFAARATFSSRQAGDFHAGSGTRINHSGFRKYNYKLDLAARLSEHQTLTVSALGDVAKGIGYPALLMDATETDAGVYSLLHEWHAMSGMLISISTRIYYNQIRHWMDDYSRDVSDREVMPDMYMPMYGTTETTGFNQVFTLSGQNYFSNISVDAYHLRSFADMDMFSIIPNSSPAYIVNLADIHQWNGALALAHTWQFAADWRLRADLRGEYSRRDVAHAFGLRQLQAFWQSPDPFAEYLSGGISSSVEWMPVPATSYQLSAGYSERAPTHMENYAYFLYNLVDGYFYTGNPELKNERSYQLQVTGQFGPNRLTLFYNNIHDYIAGVLQEGEFKIYSNIGQADLYGIEAQTAFTLPAGLQLMAQAAYTYGYNRFFDEPLPMIPPFMGSIELNWQPGELYLGAELRYSARQDRIAVNTTREDITGDFTLLNLRGRYHINHGAEVKFGMENIFDRLYHDHLSINNLPAPGRNFYLGINYHFLND